MPLGQCRRQRRRPVVAVANAHTAARRLQLPNDFGFGGVGRGERGGLDDAVPADAQVQAEAVKRLADDVILAECSEAGKPLAVGARANWQACNGMLSTCHSGSPAVRRPARCCWRRGLTAQRLAAWRRKVVRLTWSRPGKAAAWWRRKYQNNWVSCSKPD
jgi:hypothetical protein